MNTPSFQEDELDQKDVYDLLKLLTDAKRLKKAETIKNSDIRLIFQSEDGYMYEIKGKKHNYFLRIDWKNKVLIHNCEDWLHRGMRDYQLCKHFVRIFQLLYKKEAKKILIDLLLHPWILSDSDDYLKNM